MHSTHIHRNGHPSAFRLFPRGAGVRYAPRFITPVKEGGDNTSDLSTLSDAQMTAIGTLVEAGVKSAVAEMTKTIQSLGTQVAELKTAKTDEQTHPPKSDDKPAEGGANAEVLKALTDLQRIVGGITAAKDTEAKSAASLTLAQAAVESKHPKMQGKEILIKRIAAMAPDSEEAAESARASVIEELGSLGVSIKDLGADPDAEGAVKTKENETDEEINARRIEEIGKNPGGSGLAGRAKN